MRFFGIFILLGLGFFVAMAAPAFPQTGTPVDRDAEWNPTKETIRAIHEGCSDKESPGFGECFIDFIKQSGASSQAVDFAKSTGNTSYLVHFFKKGRVDLAYVHYPFRANENEGWVLVNGNPPMIDVDDLSRLPKAQLDKNPAYLRIKERYPDVLLFGGDRTMMSAPAMVNRPEGGQRFIVDYRLLNGCRACKRVGQAIFAFDFDSNGIFLRSTLLEVK